MHSLRIPQRKKAGWQAGGNGELRTICYHAYRRSSRENLRDEVGELLFALALCVEGRLSHVGWRLFERLLRQYIERGTA